MDRLFTVTKDLPGRLPDDTAKLWMLRYLLDNTWDARFALDVSKVEFTRTQMDNGNARWHARVSLPEPKPTA